MRSILDSIGTRLDESRDTSRYLIGLLVFLGLLGHVLGLASDHWFNWVDHSIALILAPVTPMIFSIL